MVSEANFRHVEKQKALYSYPEQLVGFCLRISKKKKGVIICQFRVFGSIFSLNNKSKLNRQSWTWVG